MSWESIGGTFPYEPSAVSWGPNRIDVFGVGNDNVLYQRWKDDNGPLLPIDGWQPIARGRLRFSSPPTAVSWGENRIDVFGVGPDGSLLHAWWDRSISNDWQDDRDWGIRGFRPGRRLAAISWSRNHPGIPNRIDVFGAGAVDGRNQLLHAWWQEGLPWQVDTLGNPSEDNSIFSDPAVASWGPNRLDIFVVSNNTLHHKVWNGGRHWEPGGRWESRGFLSGKPVAVSWGPNRVDVFGVGHPLINDGTSGNEILHHWWDGDTSPDWQLDSIGGETYGQISAVAWRPDLRPGRIEVFSVNNERTIYRRRWNGNSWLPEDARRWQDMGNGLRLGLQFMNAPVPVVQRPGEIHLFEHAGTVAHMAYTSR